MRGEWLVLVAAIALVVPALGLRPRPRAGLELRVLVPALAALAVILIGSSIRFAFYADDFQYLVLARIDPFAIEPQRRLLGIQLPFFMAARAGMGAFALLNVAALAAAAAALGALLETGGWTRTEAWLAALLFATSLPAVELLPWAAGFQQLAAWAAVLGAAAAMNAGGRRLGALAIGLSLAVVILKWPLAPLAPALGWLFGALCRDRAPHVTAGAAAGAIGIALYLVEPEPSAFHAGVDAVLANLEVAGGRLGEVAGRAAVGLALVLAARARREGPLVGAVFAGASSRDVLRPALVLGAISLAPFLLNDAYFAGYYLGLALAWLAALAARALVFVAPRRGIAVAVFVALWFPHSVALDRWTDPRYEELAAALDEARVALATAPEAPAFSVVARCSDPDATQESAAALDRLWGGSEGEWGLRWVSGRHHARFVRDGEAPIAVRFCEDEAPRFRVEP